MTKNLRWFIKECRNDKNSKYCPVHMADRIGNLSDCPYDNWRWQRLNDVKDIMQKASNLSK